MGRVTRDEIARILNDSDPEGGVFEGADPIDFWGQQADAILAWLAEHDAQVLRDAADTGMSARIGMEATVFDDGTSQSVRVFSARQFAGWRWSRQAVTRDSAAMFGAWRGLVDSERREIEEERAAFMAPPTAASREHLAKWREERG